jgi:F-type H+-transporting ATPase subunit b
MMSLAAEGSSPTHLEWLPALTSLLVFTLFFWVLKVKVWPQILKGLDDRQRKIRDEIEAAEAARREADEALGRYQESLAAARSEAADLIAKARADAKAVADDLRSRNAAELQEIKERASKAIDAAKRAAITEIHGEAATLAASIAAKILKREVSPSDQDRLVEESLRELANANRG